MNTSKVGNNNIMSENQTKYEPDNKTQTPPPETSLSTNEPTTYYDASSLDSPLLGIISDRNNKTIRNKSGKFRVASKKEKDRQNWLNNFVWNNNDIKAYTSIGILQK